MDQKTFVIIFAVFLLFVTLGMLIGRYKDWDMANSSPSPAPDYGKSLFGNSPDQQQVSIDDYFDKNFPMQGNQDNQFSDPNLAQQQQQQIQGIQKQDKQYSSFPGILDEYRLQDKKAVIETNKGIIEFEIFPDAPKAASNFIFLAEDTFYDGIKFHRVVPGFVIQAGDPQTSYLPLNDPRVGSGGPGYTFQEDKVFGSYDRGVVAMAKKGNEPAGTGGSQFFIMTANNPLPSEYVIFGKVIRGMDIVDKIQEGDVIQKVSIRSLN
jgi:cyclophilin family peptidyl-prolyl cis-trans isomerase